MADSASYCIGFIFEGSNATGLLDNPEFRTQILNELFEIMSFLTRRAEEQAADHGGAGMLNVQVGDSKFLNDRKLTQQMIAEVENFIALFENHRLQSLSKLHDSASLVWKNSNKTLTFL